MQWAIETENIVKHYGSIKALENVSIRVKKGEIFGFLGPNGAGKTTFIKILLNLSFSDSGNARLLGIDSAKVTSRKKVGFLPETIYAYASLTVEEFLIFHTKLIGVDYNKIHYETHEILHKLGIAHEQHKKLGTLSKGIKQRVGIAQALLHSPELLLLDEPTSGLDPIGIKDVRDILLDLKRRGTAIFINSHLLSEIERTCDRIAIINKGKIVATGNKDDLSNKEKYLEIGGEGFTDSMINELENLSKKSIKVADSIMRVYPRNEEDALIIHEIIARNRGRIKSFRWTGESLEDIFYRLIKDEDM